MVSYHSIIQYLRLNASLNSNYRVTDSTGYRPKFDWGYGLNTVVNVGSENQLILPEAYVKGRLGAFELYVGRRKEIIGLVDTLLTSGSYIWSGNTLTNSQNSACHYQYLPLFLLQKVLYRSWGLSHMVGLKTIID